MDKSFDLRWRTGLPLLNWLGKRFGRICPLDADWLIEHAEQETGLNNWGDPDVRAPLVRIIAGYEKSGLLTPVGRRILRRVLLGFLVQRLRIVDKINESPEISSRQVDRPVFIVGMPRSGTSLLYNLLALDTRFRALRTREMFNPLDDSPLGPVNPDRKTPLRDYFYPGLNAIHPSSPLDIEESTRLLANSFYAPGFFSLFGESNDYETWLTEQPEEQWVMAYKLYKQQMQILDRDGMKQRWLLKSPAHAFSLDILLHVFPDARVIVPVREMEVTFPSMASLFATFRSLYNSPVGRPHEWQRALELACETQSRLAESVDAFQESIMVIDFDRLVQDQEGSLRQIYNWLETPPPKELAESIDAYRQMDTHRGGHSYRLEQFGIELGMIEQCIDTDAWGFLRQQATTGVEQTGQAVSGDSA